MYLHKDGGVTKTAGDKDVFGGEKQEDTWAPADTTQCECPHDTELNRSHEADHPLSHHHLHRPNTDMLSKMKKKLKTRLPGSKHKPGRTGVDTDGEPDGI